MTTKSKADLLWVDKRLHGEPVNYRSCDHMFKAILGRYNARLNECSQEWLKYSMRHKISLINVNTAQIDSRRSKYPNSGDLRLIQLQFGSSEGGSVNRSALWTAGTL